MGSSSSASALRLRFLVDYGGKGNVLEGGSEVVVENRQQERGENLTWV
jgi:hypothetical protein